MNTYLLEPFLTHYYLLEAICDSFLTEKERRKLYDELARLFCLSDKKKLKELYALSHSEPFDAVRDLVTYQRLCRVIEFAQQGGQEVGLTDIDRMILAQKREAMHAKEEIFNQAKNLTRETVSSSLLRTATNGNIKAMAVLSFLEYHGICVCKDADEARKRIRLCAKWNDLFGNLMGLAYDADKTLYVNILYTTLRNASQKPVFEHICACHGYREGGVKDAAVRIVEKAFALGIVTAKQFDRAFAKVAFSEVVSAEDKEKLLLTKKRDAISSLTDIPFDIASDKPFHFDKACADKVALPRKAELDKIVKNMALAEYCPMQAYKPLLIVSPDEFVAEMYNDLLESGLRDMAFVEIDARTLTAKDFVGSGENVFLRGLSETKQARTVFLFKHCEALESEQTEELIKALDFEYRKKYKLFDPPVSMDLSGVVVLLSAGAYNTEVGYLAACCETLRADRVRADEKPLMVKTVFASRADFFGCESMTLEEEAARYLEGFDAVRVQEIVDGALRSAIFEGKHEITAELICEVCKEQGAASPRKEFGFMGGVANA